MSLLTVISFALLVASVSNPTCQLESTGSTGGGPESQLSGTLIALMKILSQKWAKSFQGFCRHGLMPPLCYNWGEPE